MSAKKSANNSSEPSQVVVGGANGNSKVKSRLLWAGTIVLLVVFVGACSWLAYQKFSGKSEKSNTAKVPTEAAKMAEVMGQKVTQTQRSEQAIYYGDYEKGQQLLESQIPSAKDDTAKIVIYMQLATNALNVKKYDEANMYAQKGLAVKKTAGTYSTLATIASAQGNKQQAINYANEQKKLLDPNASAYARQVEDINKFIEEQK